MVATSQGHARVVQALLRAGADPNARERDGLSLLIQAVRSESRTVVRALLRAGADVNRVESHGGSRETALMTAAMYGNLAMVRLLIEAGAEVSARSAKGDSALDLARRLRQEKVADLLRGAGAEERPRRSGKRSSQ
jgi:ankyrin repeat protein